MEKNKNNLPHNKGEKKGVYLDMIRYNEYEGKKLNRCAGKMAQFIIDNNIVPSHNIKEILIGAKSLAHQIKILQYNIKSSYASNNQPNTN